MSGEKLGLSLVAIINDDERFRFEQSVGPPQPLSQKSNTCTQRSIFYLAFSCILSCCTLTMCSWRGTVAPLSGKAGSTLTVKQL